MELIYKKRRQALLNKLNKGALVIITTNPKCLRNGDVYYPFRADSNFLYMSGFNEPQAMIALSGASYIVFLREKDKTRNIWDGDCLGVSDANKVLMADQAFAISSLEDELPKLIAKASNVYYDFKPSAVDNKIIKHLTSHKSLTPYLQQMRMVKDDFEVALIQKAVDISIDAHKKAMQQTKAGLYEYEIASIFDYNFKKNNAEHAYPLIVAGGKNACTLHYIKNNDILNTGELLLVDAGCEFAGYASDITRTFPISGRFSKPQKAIYEIVLQAQLAAISSIKPDEEVTKPHKVASNIIKQGLVELGILKKGQLLLRFFMHGTRHFMGLDVHDIIEYKKTHNNLKFKQGMITTVEPGIYIRPSNTVDPMYWGIGVRIEDDVLVTDTANKVLSSGLVKQVDAIESLMNTK